MKTRLLLFILLTCSSLAAYTQTFDLTHMAMSETSKFRPISGKIEILDSTVVFTMYTRTDSTLDSTVTVEKIIKKKKWYVKTELANGVNNYDYYVSDDKKERKAGIYYFAVTFAANSGKRLTLMYRGKLRE